MPDLERLSARLGVPLGPALGALVELAHTLSPKDPAGALWRLEFYLDWIHPDSSETADAALRLPGITPRNLLPFAATSKETLHFGFLMREEKLALEERPIVLVSPGSVPRVVAPSLASFLGLVAYAGADLVRRETSLEAWKRARAEKGQAAEFLKVSAALCALPGVVLPDDPGAVVKAAPDLAL